MNDPYNGVIRSLWVEHENSIRGTRHRGGFDGTDGYTGVWYRGRRQER